ncbi:DUF397 domain-containing protein [Streptomyces sp. NPDC126499]|uniref:DUF397 domain-containing protein n=1 Tax=Streptomyces sp. NPDC126499 TaxID=3155314 RepID=UPI003330B7F2
MDKRPLYEQNLTRAVWWRSRHSREQGLGCVEVTRLGGGAVALRDSECPERGDLRFTAAEWAAFCAGVRAGEFDMDVQTDAHMDVAAVTGA